MLRLVAQGEKAPQNEELRAALQRVTFGSSSQRVFGILEEHEAEALYCVLVSRSFTQTQLDAWVGRLQADHPYERKALGPRPGLWVWVKWVFGGNKPKIPPTEPISEWRRRAEAFVDKQISRVDEPAWLERSLQALDNVRPQIQRETGKSQWAMPVLRWALVQLLTIPSDGVTSDTRATGSDAQLG